MASNRSSQVHALSGRVQGLKFMQRATALSAPSTPIASSSSAPATPAAAATPTRAATTAEDDEHWVLPGASQPPAMQKSEKQARTIHEPSWDAWMLSSTAVTPSSSLPPPSASTSTTPEQLVLSNGTRRTFGAWARKKRVRKDDEEDEEEEGEGSADQSEEEDEREGRKGKGKSREKYEKKSPKGFLKPGASSDLPAPLRAPSKKARKLAASHEGAREAAYERKLADKVGTDAARRRKGKGKKGRAEVQQDSGDEMLEGWENQ